MKTKNRQSSIVNRQCHGFTLIEALMASVLLAACAAGVLLPVSAAAAAQADAQRRVVATRFAADVIELRMAGQLSDGTFTPDDIGAGGAAYADLVCQLQAEAVQIDGVGGLTLVTVSVTHNGRPMATLRTLEGT